MSRTPRRRAWLARALCLAMLAPGGAAGGAAESAAPLGVCLAAEDPPFSSQSGPDRGIHHDIAAHVAGALGRPLRVDWVRAAGDDEVSIGHEASRLLAETDCELIAGYPLTRDALTTPAGVAPGPPGTSRPARPPQLLASRPYLSLPLTVVSGAERATVERLDDLVGVRVAVERGSLASVIAHVYAGAVLREGLVRVAAGSDAIFASLETGAADVAFVERHRFELYRQRAPDTSLRETGYRHPLGVNAGFVGRTPGLIAEVDAVLRDLVSSGVAAEIVEARGLGYAPPSRPAVLPPLTPRLLAQPAPRP